MIRKKFFFSFQAQLFRERSEQRCRAIKEASRKRVITLYQIIKIAQNIHYLNFKALIVANRRAVAADLLKEKRPIGY